MDKPKRGRRGQGTIYKTKDGRYRGSISLGYKPDGITRDRRYVYGRTRAEARQKLNDLIKAYNAGELPENPQNLTLGEYLDQWLEGTVKLTRSPTTHADYETVVRTHIKPYTLARQKMTKLTAVHVTNWLKELAEAGVSPWRIRMAFIVLRTALNHAVYPLKYIASNPLADMEEPPKPPPKRRRPLSPIELITLIDSMMQDKFAPMWLILATTGMRLGECLGIRKNDFDLDDLDSAGIYLGQAIREARGRHSISEGKYGSAKGYIPLIRFVAELVVEYMEKYPPAGPDALVFTNAKGGPLYRNNLYRDHWQPILDRAGIGHLAPKDLRHTTAVLLFKKGAKLHEVQSLLRHARPTMTVDNYGQYTPQGREVAELMERILNEARMQKQKRIGCT